MTIVTIAAGDYRAEVNRQGGALHSLHHRSRALTTTPIVATAPRRWDGAVLAPWPNRIDGGRFSFDGVQYQLRADEPGLGHALHGTVWSNLWVIADGTDEAVVMTTSVESPPGYPWAVELELEYAVGADGLTIRATARNRGDVTAPFGFGVHPYLVAPTGELDRCHLSFTAGRRLVTDDRLIPVGETVNTSTRFDFASPRPIGDTELDTTFGGLEHDGRGRAVLTLTAPGGAGSVSCWWDESFPWLQLFTPPRLDADTSRRSIAVEPMTCPPNAFNSGIDVVALEPGAEWSGALGIAADP